MTLTLSDVKTRVTAVIAALGNDPTTAAALTSTFNTQGKVYEAWCLGEVLQRLNQHEQFDAVLVGGTKVVLKSAPGRSTRRTRTSNCAAEGSPSRTSGLTSRLRASAG